MLGPFGSAELLPAARKPPSWSSPRCPSGRRLGSRPVKAPEGVGGRRAPHPFRPGPAAAMRARQDDLRVGFPPSYWGLLPFPADLLPCSPSQVLLGLFFNVHSAVLIEDIPASEEDFT